MKQAFLLIRSSSLSVPRPRITYVHTPPLPAAQNEERLRKRTGRLQLQPLVFIYGRWGGGGGANSSDSKMPWSSQLFLFYTVCSSYPSATILLYISHHSLIHQPSFSYPSAAILLSISRHSLIHQPPFSYPSAAILLSISHHSLIHHPPYSHPSADILLSISRHSATGT